MTFSVVCKSKICAEGPYSVKHYDPSATLNEIQGKKTCLGLKKLRGKGCCDVKAQNSSLKSFSGRCKSGQRLKFSLKCVSLEATVKRRHFFQLFKSNVPCFPNRDKDYHLRTYKSVVMANKLIDWLIAQVRCSVF